MIGETPPRRHPFIVYNKRLRVRSVGALPIYRMASELDDSRGAGGISMDGLLRKGRHVRNNGSIAW